MLPMPKIDVSTNLFFVNSCNKYVDTPIEKAPKKIVINWSKWYMFNESYPNALIFKIKALKAKIEKNINNKYIIFLFLK